MSRLTGWRRIANAIWRAPRDPQIYGSLDVDAAPVARFLERARAAGHHVTPTHVVGRAVAHALREVPDLNVRLRGGAAVSRSTVDVFFITAVHGGRDLSGVKVVDVPSKPAVALAAELDRRATAMKGGRDADFSKSKAVMDRLPMPLLRLGVRLVAFATEALQLDVPALGLHPSPFGSAMVTSVGMFGIPQGFAPLAWMYDVPILVLVAEITEKPVAVDGRVEARRVLPVTVTIDHRYVDGWHLACAMRAFRDYLAAPERFEPPTVATPPPSGRAQAGPARHAPCWNGARAAPGITPREGGTMRVEALMTQQVATCHPEDSLARAAQIMWERDCGCVPVVDHGGRVVGLVTDRDALMAAWTQGKALAAVAVATAMARKVLTCRPEDTIEDAERLLREAQVRRLPVVDAGGRLVGVLSLRDLACRAHRTRDGEADGLQGDAVALTLAAISAPRRPAAAD